jgi:NAD(P)-dependent dehydrogenase (short-subunit alcohol dehydrogenase family)
MRLEGRVALVTGAANGIGRGVALALAKRRCELELVDLDDAGLWDVRETALRLGSPRIETARVDVGSSRELDDYLRTLRARRTALGLVVANAGVSVAGEVERVEERDFEWLFAINFFGAIRVIRGTLPLLAREGGRVVGVLSPFATLGFPTKSAYAASKFALRGWLESVAAEVAGSNVGVTLFHPGATVTELVRRGRAVDAELARREAEFLGRRGRPAEEVGEALVRAAERERARAFFGLDARALDWAARFAPPLARAIAARAARRAPFA